MSDSLDERIEAIAATSDRWQDPEYPPRAETVEKTLEEDNRFTEQAIAFAINQQMSLLSPEALRAWIGERQAASPGTVGVLNAGNIPMVGLQDFLAVVLTGHRYMGSVSSKSPYLLPAFVTDLRNDFPGLDAQFVDDASELFAGAEVLIATGSDDAARWAEAQCDEHDIPPERRLIRGHRYSVAVIDGNESEDEREGLAEDALLHEGYGCRNVAIIWAPRDLNPDSYLHAFALFRGVFPTHPEMPGSLEMQQAFLDATDQSHAYGEGLEFLLSRGEPEPQRPGHVRWSEYDAVDEAAEWIEQHQDEIQLVVARPHLADRLPAVRPIVSPGHAQRPSLDWAPDGKDTIEFLVSL